MRISVIGGAGLRLPLLAQGLATSRLPIRELCLYDTDQEHLATIAPVAAHYAKSIRVLTFDNPEACVRGSSFVFLSIRPGQMDQRARDERICLKHGVIGQETVGAAGFAMALRAIGPSVNYAKLVQQHAPDAWIINFTNPVSIVTQAVHESTDARIIGICDTPTELWAEAAEFLHLIPSECEFDYIGLNHLGFLREVYWQGKPQLERWWSSPEKLTALYSRPMFRAAQLAALRLLPSEYLYFYYHSEQALEHLIQAAHGRGEQLAQQNQMLWKQLKQSGDSAIECYEAYLRQRDASYMQAETADIRERRALGRYAQTGYDKIAVKVLEGLYFNTREVLALNVLNHGNIPELAEEDVIEVPCVIGSNGPRALHAGSLPDAIKELVLQVKRYERSAVQAAMAQDETLAVRALSENPLIPSVELASSLVKALGPFW